MYLLLYSEGRNNYCRMELHCHAGLWEVVELYTYMHA